MMRWLACVGVIGALAAMGCPGRGTGDDGAGTSSATSSPAATTTMTAGSSADDTASGGTAQPPPSGCEDTTADYTATAEVLDEGLGPIAAPVTIRNCTDAVAYVYQDCCFGAAFQLQRKDAAEDPWRDSLPGIDCDCMGPVDPLVIDPLGEIVVDTDPAEYDSEPICQEPYRAIYRWIFLVGPQPECTECWQDVPTNEFDWYCEG